MQRHHLRVGHWIWPENSERSLCAVYYHLCSVLLEQGTSKCRTIKQCYSLVEGSVQDPIIMTLTHPLCDDINSKFSQFREIRLFYPSVTNNNKRIRCVSFWNTQNSWKSVASGTRAGKRKVAVPSTYLLPKRKSELLHSSFKDYNYKSRTLMVISQNKNQPFSESTFISSLDTVQLF